LVAIYPYWEQNRMAILALITKPEEISLVVPWAAEFAKARDSSLTGFNAGVVCGARFQQNLLALADVKAKE
jgi:hypothetical protein